MLTRTISAIIAIAILIAAYSVWGIYGLFGVSSLVVIVCNYEYTRLTFAKANAPFHIQIMFIVLSLTVCFTNVSSDVYAAGVAAAAAVVFLASALLTVRNSKDLPSTLALQSAGLVGLFYCGLFPSLVLKILFIENGAHWLVGLLAIVFTGDTCAYLTGRSLGKRKLLEAVSPKKTVEGSIGGLVGSAIAGAVLWKYSPGHSLALFLAMSVVTGLFAQVGDLFESLLKRIADVKDSGRIMPGHGGALDRIDGILFAGPVYYVLLRVLLGN